MKLIAVLALMLASCGGVQVESFATYCDMDQMQRVTLSCFLGAPPPANGQEAAHLASFCAAKAVTEGCPYPTVPDPSKPAPFERHP